MDKDLISVIVPVYKVEAYLEECINSIINQTYKNLEIILVDDGSPDNSGIICDKYAKKDERIKVIHKENGGLSDARNAGIDVVTGKYITFIDSDDYIENLYIEKLYLAIKNNNTNISQCGFSKVSNSKEILEKIGYDKNYILSGKEMLKDLYMYKNSVENTVVWNKMYLIDLFKNIRFPKGKIHEDEYITYKILYFQEKVSIIKDYLYNYRQTDNSITHSKFDYKKLDYLEAVEERVHFFKENEEEFFYNKTLEKYANKIIDYYSAFNHKVKDSGNEQKELLNKFNKIYKEINKLKVSKKRKIKYLMFKYCPNLLMKIFKRDS